MKDKKSNVEVIIAPEPPPGPLSRVDLLTIALGTVLGGGIISLLPAGIKAMGTSAAIGFPVAVIMGVIYVMPVIFISSTVRMSGGLMSVAAALGTPLIAGLYGLGYMLSAITLGSFGLTLANYVVGVFPSVNLIMCACVVSFVFYVVNMLGSKFLARMQNVMFGVLAVGLFLFIAMGLPKVTQPVFDFSSPTFMPNDFATTFSGLMVLFGACMAYQNVVSHGRNAMNATKDMPFALIGSAIFIFFLYLGCGVVAAGVLPLEEAASTTLLATVKAIFPDWLYIVWMIAVPGLLICTTLNGLMSTYSEQFAQCSRDGWLPDSWSKPNRFGAYPIPLTILFVLPLIPTIAGLSVSQIMMSANLLIVVFDLMLGYCMLKFPTRYAEDWKRSKMHVPNAVFYTVVVLRMVIRIMGALSAILTLSTTTIVTLLVIVAVLIGWTMYRTKKGARIKISLWAASESKQQEIPQGTAASK